jgi:homoserine acetyltransferase
VEGFPAVRSVDLTCLDISRAILQALDRLGIGRVHLTTGGSLGGMVTLTLAALAPERFERMLPLAPGLSAGIMSPVRFCASIRVIPTRSDAGWKSHGNWRS